MATGKLRENVHYMVRLDEYNFHELEDHKDDTVVILGMNEFVWSNKAQHDPTGRQFKIDYLNPFIEKYQDVPEDRRPDIKFLLSGYKYPTNEYAKMHHDDVYNIEGSGIPWAELVFWPTFYFGYGIHDFYRSNEQIDANRLERPPTQLFTLFQNRGTRPHRVSLMHSVHQKGLQDHGIIRYCNSQQGWDQFLHEVDKEKGRVGNHNIHTSLLNTMMPSMHKYFSPDKWWPPGQSSFDTTYFDGLIDLVSTTSIVHVMYCEKTLRPLLTGKPFLLFGAPNSNNHLKDFGFELYDEIFDYTNDNNFSDQIYGFPHNLMKIRRRSRNYDQMLKPLFDMDKSPAAVKDLYLRTREKARHNQRVLMDIIFDDDRIPYVFERHRPEINLYFAGVLHSREKLANDSYFAQFLSKHQIEQANIGCNLRLGIDDEMQI